MSPNISEEHPFVRHLVRYGVPALILIFYVTASLHFDYTPDSTFATLNALHSSHIDSLWTALLALATVFNIDVLLAAKVFSLLFACFGILISYLIANEVLNDHLLAFCVTISVSMQAWLIQLAPTGSGLSLALFLSLVTIFFLLRNEYIIAGIFAGLASLVAWQAAGLLFVMMLDAYINAVDKNRSVKMIASIALVFAGVVLPWILYSLYVGRLLVPTMEVLSIVPTFSLQVSFEILLLVGAMFVGIVLVLMRDKSALNTQIAILLWIAIASFSHHQMFALALPLIIIYIFFSVQRLSQAFGKRNLSYIVAVLLATLILAYNQMLALPAAENSMNSAVAQMDEMKAIAMWLTT
ncbi:MAG: hypothetical protein AAB344_05875, partial [Bacteroidota bacterium]